MKTNFMGESRIPISSITLGCMTFTGDSNWGPQDRQDSIETIRTALDVGVCSFDTAESYAQGLTEEILGEALGSDRTKVSIFSKVAAKNLRPDDLIAACEGTLRRIGTDYIDLYQIHWPNPSIPIEETMGALLRLKEQGKIREIGVSNFGKVDMDVVLPYQAVVSNQLAYNLFFRGIEYSILPKCRENGISVMTYSSLAQGLLTGKYRSGNEFPVGRARTKIFACTREGSKHGGSGCEELVFKALYRLDELCKDAGHPMADVALAWNIAQEGIASVIAGARTKEQVLVNSHAAELELSEAFLREITELTEPIKAFFGDDADPWMYGRIH